MYRRTFLRFFGISVVGLSTGLAGCVRNLQFFGIPLPASQAIQDVNAARDIMQHIVDTQTMPAPSSVRRLREVERELRGVTRINAAQALMLAGVVAPALQRLQEPRSKRRPTARRQDTRISPQKGLFTINPGEAVAFDFKGYCMDPSRPVPSRGEPLRFIPLAEYVHPELKTLFVNAVRLAEEKRVSADMQKLVWAFRTVDATDKSWADGLTRREYQVLDEAMPGGAQLFMQVRRRLSGKYRGSASTAERAHPGIRPVDMSQNSSNLLEQLFSLPVNEQIPPNDATYTMLAPGVAALGVGGGLAGVLVIANTTDQPYQFDFDIRINISNCISRMPRCTGRLLTRTR